MSHAITDEGRNERAELISQASTSQHIPEAAVTQTEMCSCEDLESQLGTRTVYGAAPCSGSRSGPWALV